MNEYITSAHFIRSKESVSEHKELIEDCRVKFNERSQSSSNYKVIHNITYPNDYVMEIRWGSANPIDILQAGRTLRLFADELLKSEIMQKKVISGKFLSYHTINASPNDASLSDIEIIERLANLLRTNPSSERIKEIREILLR